MPRLRCKFRDFVAIIESHGFEVHRRGSGSHVRYRGIVSGEVRYVDVAGHSPNDEIKPKTLKSMIRQAGLPKALFLR